RLLEEALAAPFKGLLVPLRLRPHAQPRVAVTELVGVVLLQRHLGAERDVLGLVGDAESTRPHHTHDAVGAVENGPGGKGRTAVQNTSSFLEARRRSCTLLCIDIGPRDGRAASALAGTFGHEV